MPSDFVTLAFKEYLRHYTITTTIAELRLKVHPNCEAAIARLGFRIPASLSLIDLAVLHCFLYVRPGFFSEFSCSN